MKNRSPRFPFLPLEEAVVLLQKLAEHLPSDPETPFKRPKLLEALGYASFHGAAVKTIGAMRAYDLLQKQEDGLTLSSVAREILGADTEEERLEFLQRAALSPLTYRMIWRRARHCNREEIEALLLERGFTEAGAKRASRIYRKNDRFARLSQLDLEPELPERGPGGRRVQRLREQGGERGWQRIPAERIPAERIRAAGNRAGFGGCGPRGDRPGSGGRPGARCLSLPLSTGAAVIPKGITENEFQTLMQTLRMWKEQLVAPAS